MMMVGDASTALPKTYSDLTPEWVSAFLSRSFPGTEVREVSAKGRTDGTCTRIALELTYAPGKDNGLPAAMFLKSLLEPGVAPDSMYRCEYDFYRTMRPGLSLETPHVYGMVLDEASSHFVLLMDDMNVQRARMGHACRPNTADEVAGVIDTLADLHAPYWDNPSVERDFPWLETHLKGPNVDHFRTKTHWWLTNEYEHSPYKKAFFPPEGHYAPEPFIKALWTLQEINERETPTVLHGDVHVGNTYVLPGGKGGIFDWQLMRKGCWAHDVTYHIVTAMAPEDRKRHEVELLQRYVAAMASRGVTMPNWDHIWLNHRQNIVWGAMMWMLTPTPQYDEERLSHLLDRSRAAMDELECLAALNCT